MKLKTAGVRSEGRYARANGIDIHYVDAGEGEPLVLLHGGMVSTNPIWAGHPFAYVSPLDTLAQHFRVVAPDTRGYGRTDPGLVGESWAADHAVALAVAWPLLLVAVFLPLSVRRYRQLSH